MGFVRKAIFVVGPDHGGNKDNCETHCEDNFTAA